VQACREEKHFGSDGEKRAGEGGGGRNTKSRGGVAGATISEVLLEGKSGR